jgi:2-phosphoglycolate phosphatase
MNMNKIKGAIFDLDGTLIDSFQAIYLSFKFAYENLGHAPLSFAASIRAVGYGLSNTFRDLLGEEQTPEAIRFFREKYREVFLENTHLLPGAQEVLETLHGRGIKLAVATNKFGPSSREILRNFRLDGLFAAILGDTDVTRNKPHPEALLRAMERMGVGGAEAIMVGDTEIDILAAQNAGIPVFAIATGTQTREELEKARPDVILEKLTDLCNYF